MSYSWHCFDASHESMIKKYRKIGRQTAVFRQNS